MKTLKTLYPIRFALFAAAALFTHAAFAGKPGANPPPPPPSSGTLVLDLPDAFNWGLTVAPSGTIYAVGNTYTTWSQLVLSSSDSGSSWSVVDDFAPPGRYVDFFGWTATCVRRSSRSAFVSHGDRKLSACRIRTCCGWCFAHSRAP